MKWEKVKIGDICDVTSSKRIFFSEYVEKGIPFFRSKEIIELSQGNEISECLYITEDRYNEIKKNFGVPTLGDMLLTSVGTIGVSYIIKNDNKFYFKDGNLTWFRKFSSKYLSKFLMYYLTSVEGKGILNNMAIGSSQKALTIATLKSIEVPCPPIEEQERIVSILTAYDDLIENNKKQIKLLEEAAQRLYKEWFVDLRFPGHENVPVVDGVPEGWERKKVSDCLALHIGGGWGKEAPMVKNNIEGYVIRGTDINDIKSGNIREIPKRFHTENDIKKRQLQKYDIVFELSNGNINNIGRSLFIDDFILKALGQNIICASFCKLFRPLDKLHALMLYFEIQDMQTSGRMLPFKKHGANGINNFAFEDFLDHELLIPSNKITIELLRNTLKNIELCRKQLNMLIKARDYLLPKLISGEIEV